jgi:hypothetical protein
MESSKKAIGRCDFKDFTDVRDILKNFCVLFECLPVRVDGKLELVNWDCDTCSHFGTNPSGGRPQCGLPGKGVSDEECVANFAPQWIRKTWFDRLFPKKEGTSLF